MKSGFATAVFSVVTLFGVPAISQASLIDLGVRLIPPPPLGNPSAEADWIEGDQGLTFGLEYLEKFDTGGGGFDGGGLAPDSGPASYTVTNPGGAATSDITWDLTGTGKEALYVLVKDGKDGGPGGSGNFYYHLYEVSDDQAVVGGPDTVTINYAKDISHISWFGGPATSVPDGGAAIILLGVSLLGMGGFRRLIGLRKG